MGFIASLLAGLMTGVGALGVYLFRQLSPRLEDGLLSFAAGAMLFVISDEIIPETHSRGFENLATFSLLAGFALMMYLDATLG
jgi:ZIP family zinc transporter